MLFVRRSVAVLWRLLITTVQANAMRFAAPDQPPALVTKV